MAFFSGRGVRPRPWSTKIQTDSVNGRPPLDDKEGMLLRQIGRWQMAFCGALLVSGGLVYHANELGKKTHPEIRTYIVEVAEPGQLRNVGLVPVTPEYKPTEPNIMFVLKYWLRHVRPVGDSKVLLGQAWAEALAFTSPQLQDWLKRELNKRYEAYWKKGKTVQVALRPILPVHRSQMAYKATWEESIIAKSGDVESRHLWEATMAVAVVPITTEEDEEEAQRNWRNGLGVLVTEVHFNDLGEIR